jgi:NAD+ synthase
LSKWELIRKHLVSFLKNETQKVGIDRVVLGLSGGIDSALVAVLCKEAFGNNLLCVMMPSQYSSDSSIDDAVELCKKFDIRYEIESIEPLLKAYESKMDTNLRKGNFSARMRMSILYDVSARENALVIGTSNKSELMLGYGTLFGDLASAINPIGDLYKSEVFEFSEYLGVNSAIIKKPPSADLWSGQSDEADLGYTYAQIDKVLKEIVEERKSKEEVLSMGYDEKLVNMLLKRVFQNQFKRKPPVIAKLTQRTINHDFLYPRDIGL